MAIRKRKRGHHDDPSAVAAEIATVRRVLANYPPGAGLTFGAPTRCPRCTNFGLVVALDGSFGGRSVNRCVSCQNEWVITARAIRLARNDRAVLTSSMTREPASDVVLDDRTDLLLPAPLAPHGIALPAALADRAAPAGIVFSRGADGDVSRQVVPPGVPAHLATAAAAARSSDRYVPRDGPMRVLLIEDDPSDIEVVKAILEPVGGGAIDLRTARTRAEGESEARAAAPDLVLLDLGLPDSHGLATVTQWHGNNAADAPVLVVSGGYRAEIADRGHELGVSGFLDKAELAELLAKGTEGTTLFLDKLTAAAAG